MNGRLLFDFGFVIGAFLLIWKLDALAYLYDIRASSDGIQFVLFSAVQVSFLPVSNIESIEEVRGGYFRLAYNFKNRLFHRTFLINKKNAFFTKKVLVTPDRPDDFTQTLVHAGVRVSTLAGTS